MWSIPLAQARVEVPSSVGGVRAALEPERAAEFDSVVAGTPAKHLVYVILDWALPPGAEEPDAVTVGRLRGGDLSGVRDGDGNPVAPTHPPLDEAEAEVAPTASGRGDR